MSLIKLHSVFAGRKTVIHLSLRTENECTRLFSILFLSSEFVAAPIFRHVPVAWLVPDVSFPTRALCDSGIAQWVEHYRIVG